MCELIEFLIIRTRGGVQYTSILASSLHLKFSRVKKKIEHIILRLSKLFLILQIKEILCHLYNINHIEYQYMIHIQFINVRSIYINKLYLGSLVNIT